MSSPITFRWKSDETITVSRGNDDKISLEADAEKATIALKANDDKISLEADAEKATIALKANDTLIDMTASGPSGTDRQRLVSLHANTQDHFIKLIDVSGDSQRDVFGVGNFDDTYGNVHLALSTTEGNLLTYLGRDTKTESDSTVAFTRYSFYDGASSNRLALELLHPSSSSNSLSLYLPLTRTHPEAIVLKSQITGTGVYEGNAIIIYDSSGNTGNAVIKIYDQNNNDGASKGSAIIKLNDINSNGGITITTKTLNNYKWTNVWNSTIEMDGFYDLQRSSSGPIKNTLILDASTGILLPYALKPTTERLANTLELSPVDMSILPNANTVYISAFDSENLSSPFTGTESDKQKDNRIGLLKQTVPSTYAVQQAIAEAIAENTTPFSFVVDEPDTLGNARFGIRWTNPNDSSDIITAFINFGSIRYADKGGFEFDPVTHADATNYAVTAVSDMERVLNPGNSKVMNITLSNFTNPNTFELTLVTTVDGTTQTHTISYVDDVISSQSETKVGDSIAPGITLNGLDIGEDNSTRILKLQWSNFTTNTDYSIHMIIDKNDIRNLPNGTLVIPTYFESTTFQRTGSGNVLDLVNSSIKTSETAEVGGSSGLPYYVGDFALENGTVNIRIKLSQTGSGWNISDFIGTGFITIAGAALRTATKVYSIESNSFNKDFNNNLATCDAGVISGVTSTDTRIVMFTGSNQYPSNDIAGSIRIYYV